MLQFACARLFVGCDAAFTAETIDEILSQVAAHAHAVHGVERWPAELVGRVTAGIR